MDWPVDPGSQIMTHCHNRQPVWYHHQVKRWASAMNKLPRQIQGKYTNMHIARCTHTPIDFLTKIAFNFIVIAQTCMPIILILQLIVFISIQNPMNIKVMTCAMHLYGNIHTWRMDGCTIQYENTQMRCTNRYLNVHWECN